MIDKESLLFIWKLRFPMELNGTNHYRVEVDGETWDIEPASNFSKVGHNPQTCPKCNEKFEAGEIIIYKKFNDCFHIVCFGLDKMAELKIIERKKFDSKTDYAQVEKLKW